MNDFSEQLKKVLPEGQIRTGESMSLHTTFRCGGLADYFVEPVDAKELFAVWKLCQKEKMPYYILGNGSNLLVSDDGYHGVVIFMGKAWAGVSVEGTCIRAGAGALLSITARQALQASLTGLEFAAGIPGTIGGAVVMNAGAYGSDMKAVLSGVTVLTLDGEVKELAASELELGYRTSCILRRGYIVLEAQIELARGTKEAIRKQMDDLAFQRKSKQPLEYPSAGSTFKRPEGYFAGKLIQDAGLRGFQVGGAQVAEKHCGFVINRDHATATDVMNLCRAVQKKVQEEFDITLEMEVKTLGIF